MQPYFFPYIGYFELIARTDRWVVFDVVQYNDKTWMTRNRILHPAKGWQYVNVPVARAPHGTPIHQILAKDRSAAQQRICGQIEHYRKRAPYFGQVVDILRQAFDQSTGRLVDINVAGLAAVCGYLDIDFNYSLCSNLNLALNDVEHAGQWALKIAEQLGATEYVNPPGGRAIFRQEEWDAAGIGLSFTGMPDFSYACRPYEFIPNLSIIDVLMWNDPQTTRRELLRQQ